MVTNHQFIFKNLSTQIETYKPTSFMFMNECTANSFPLITETRHKHIQHSTRTYYHPSNLRGKNVQT